MAAAEPLPSDCRAGVALEVRHCEPRAGGATATAPERPGLHGQTSCTRASRASRLTIVAEHSNAHSRSVRPPSHSGTGCKTCDVTDEVWRPLGVDTDEAIAEYDALHDGVPLWMSAPYWAWVRESVSSPIAVSGGTSPYPRILVALVEKMSTTLRLNLPNLRTASQDAVGRSHQMKTLMAVLTTHGAPLQIADYLLAHSAGSGSQLESLLERSRSAWRVGTRASRPGLVRRVPLGAQVAADSVIGRAGQAGIRLAKAWESLYGLVPNASEAYRLAILAVEDAVVPVVSPADRSATLGKVLKQLEDQGDWRLPLEREHPRAPSTEVLVGMLRLLWHGQHDRHGGQPSVPGNVSVAEASVAVSLAVSLVSWFDAGLVSRDER